MRSSGRTGTLTALWVLAALSADALVVETWTERSVQFTNLGRAEVSATATGLATLTSSSGHLSTLSVGVNSGLAVTQTIAVTGASSLLITALIPSFQSRPDLQGGVFGNVSGAIAHSASALAPNTMPLTGGYTLCLLVQPLPPCLAQIDLPLGGTQAGSQVGLGVGGLLTIFESGLVFSLAGAPYTVNSVSAPNRTDNFGLEVFTARGFAHGPASLTSSTALTSGVLQLVTAGHQINRGNGRADVSGQISRLTIHVAPEPGPLVLFAAGAGGVALLGGRRSRRSGRLREEPPRAPATPP